MAKKKRKRRSRGTLVIIAIALLIAGFIVRRTMLPQFLHYLAYRPAEKPGPESSTLPLPETETTAGQVAGEPSAAPAATPVAQKSPVAPGEHITASDQQRLEEILKSRNR